MSRSDGWHQTEATKIFNMEDWVLGASCAGIPNPEIFFPERGATTEPAKRMCVDCPVRKNCLDYSLRNHERYGVWGGLAERERRTIKRSKKIEKCPECGLIRVFFEKGAKKCDKCSPQKKLGLV